MNEDFYWNVFKNTGSVESYLSYKTIQNTSEKNVNDKNTNDNVENEERE